MSGDNEIVIHTTFQPFKSIVAEYFYPHAEIEDLKSLPYELYIYAGYTDDNTKFKLIGVPITEDVYDNIAFST
jgi:hypothetical protein